MLERQHKKKRKRKMTTHAGEAKTGKKSKKYKCNDPTTL
jgi:hypothetical protein